MSRLGYPSQNLSIPASTNHTLRLASLRDLEKLRGVVRRNLEDLEAILRWNAEHGVQMFRIGQDLVPFASHPAFPYDWETEHGGELRRAGKLALSLGIRLSMHPGQYIQPGSLRSEVVERSLGELRYAARVLALVGSTDGVIVLHLGGANGDRRATVERFARVLEPEEGVLAYLALENDERTWTAAEVVEAARKLGVPAITDNLHHELNPGGLTLGEALDLSLPTWENRDARPKVHLSSQDPEKRPGAHAWSIHQRDREILLEALDGREADVMVEAKGKEKALAPMGVPTE